MGLEPLNPPDKGTEMTSNISILDAITADPKNVQLTCKHCNCLFIGSFDIIEHLEQVWS